MFFSPCSSNNDKQMLVVYVWHNFPARILVGFFVALVVPDISLPTQRGDTCWVHLQPGLTKKKKGLALKHQNTKSPPRTGHTWQWVYKVSRSLDLSRRQDLQNLGLWLRRKSKKIPELRVLRNQVTNGPSGCSLSPPSLRSTQLLP